MKNVRLFFLAFREPQPIEARIRKRLVVVASLIASRRRNRFDTHAKQIMRKRLKKRQRLRNQLAILRQIIRIADFFELRDLLFLRKAWKISSRSSKKSAMRIIWRSIASWFRRRCRFFRRLRMICFAWVSKRFRRRLAMRLATTTSRLRIRASMGWGSRNARKKSRTFFIFRTEMRRSLSDYFDLWFLALARSKRCM